MSEARLTDVAALDEFKAALATFAVQASQALTEVGLEVRRALDWITVDRRNYWENEVRRASDAVCRAKDNLSHARIYKRIGDFVPGCLDEKQALEMAKRRLEHAERKVEAVRRWSGIARRAVDEFQGPVQQLLITLDGDVPKAMAVLERMNRALAQYAAVGVPPAIQWEELQSGDSASSVAQPATDDQTARSSPSTQPSGDGLQQSGPPIQQPTEATAQ